MRPFTKSMAKLATIAALTLAAPTAPILFASTASAAACTGLQPGDLASTSDVTLTIGPPVTIPGITYSASSCKVNGGNVNAAQELALAVGLLPNAELADKSDTAGSGTVGGIEFTVTAGNANSGSWTLAWKDANGALAPNLPVQLDFVAVLKASNEATAYLFNDVVLTADPLNGSGSFSVQADPNRRGVFPRLSHLSLYVANFETPPGPNPTPTPTPAPEPATLALFGMGLASLGFAMRRRRRV